MPKIVADTNISLLNECFSNLGTIVAKPGRQITANDLKDADILLVRSVTKVDKNLLDNTNIKFVGSITSGIDHIDVDYLKNNDIKFVAAKGANAESVVEYVLSSISFFVENNKVDLSNCCVGIVGVGNVGLRLYYALYKLGINAILTDPFKPNYKLQLPTLNYIPLLDLIQKANIITLHCPLTTTGKYPTYHLLNKNNFPLIKSGGCIINSSRGSVVDNIALADYLDKNNNLNLAFDVWENEPNIYQPLLNRCQIATPHIAGYSYDAKLRGTQFMYSKLAEYLGIKHNNKIELNEFWNKFNPNKLTNKQKILDAFSRVSSNYNVKDDTKKLKTLYKNNSTNNKLRFDNLRYQYNDRRQFNIMDFINHL